MNHSELGAITRRQFCRLSAAGLPLLAAGSGLLAHTAAPKQNGERDFDILIKDGTVIDPSQRLHALLDIGIKNGKIVDVSKDIPSGGARTVIPAKDKFVTPGLIDIHTHVYEGVGLQGLNPDRFHLTRGSTTVVDAGSAGHLTIAGFRKYIVIPSATRVYALVDIGALGLVNGIRQSMENLENVDPKAAAQAVNNNKPATVGLKARLSRSVAGDKDLEGLRRTREAAEAANVPMMIHVGDTYSPLKDILALMRPGDILTHYLHGEEHGVLDSSGRLLPEVLEARRQGILFDVGHGSGHFSFELTEKCIEHGFLPDIISSDVSTRTMNGPVYDLPTTLSKFLHLGLSLDDVVKMATTNPARAFNYGADLGTLRTGSDADVAIFELRQGSFEFTDSHRTKRTGTQKLFPFSTLRAGKLYQPIES